MKFTLSWLKQFLDTDKDIDFILESLTNIGFEVEDFLDYSQSLKDFEIAQIISFEKHPSADKLNICQVDTSEGQLQVICGAGNVKQNMKVVLAKVGATIPNGNFKIKKANIRGVESNGMLCSEFELNLGGDNDGIIELQEDAKVGGLFYKYWGLDDPVICINVTPNRPDALGVYGIARDLAAAGVGNLKNLDVLQENVFWGIDKETIIDGIAVKVKSTKIEQDDCVCPIFLVCEIKNINNKVTPIWLKRLLKNIGVCSTSPAVDISNYILYSFNQPIHIYDSDKISGSLKVDILDEDQDFLALNGKKYSLRKGDVVVKDNNQVQCIAGIMGSMNSSCTCDTSNILIEAACFAPDYIIATGRHLMLDSDSRYRFERGIDKNFVLTAMQIAKALIKEICGGECFSIVVHASDDTDAIRNATGDNISRIAVKKAEKIADTVNDIVFPVSYFKSHVGFTLDVSEMIKILKKLGFQCSYSNDLHFESYNSSIANHISNDINKCSIIDNKSSTVSSENNNGRDSGVINIKVPSWRHDIHGAEDIAEEIIRIYGYDKIPEIKISNSGVRKIIPKEYVRISDIKRLLANAGYNELVTWSFMHSAKAKYFTDAIVDKYKIQNPISLELDYMRPSIIPNLLDALSKNSARGFDNLSLFETGTIFENNHELMSISGIRVGLVCPSSFLNSKREFDVFDVKSDLAKIFAFCGISFDKFQMKYDAPSYYHPSRSASLYLGKVAVAKFGQLHPEILKKFEITAAARNMEVCAFELRVADIPFSKPKYGMKSDFAVSNYQSVKRDYAFIVDKECIVGGLLDFVTRFDKKFIKSADIFDIYYGDKIPGDKKSIALSVQIQVDNKTMTSEEINAFSDKLVEAVNSKFDAKLRDV